MLLQEEAMDLEAPLGPDTLAKGLDHLLQGRGEVEGKLPEARKPFSSGT